MSDQAIIPIAQAVVLIAGYPVIAVLLPDGQSGAVLPTLCAILGLKPSTQAHLIHTNPALSEALVLVALPTPGGTQNTNVLLEWGIALWAAGLQKGRRPPAYRELLLTIQRQAGRTIALQFAKQTSSSTSAPPPPPSQPAAPQSIWREWHALIDRTEAMYEQRYQESQAEHQEFRHRLAKVEQQLRQELTLRQKPDAHPPRITAPEAGEVRSTLGSFAERLVQINLLASRARQKYGYPIAMTLAGLAERFQVADVFDLPDKDWPAVLDWFSALLEE